MSSFKAQVIADASGKWTDNAIRLPDKEQAEAYAQNLMDRWMMVREKRVVESDDPVTHTFTEGALEAIDG